MSSNNTYNPSLPGPLDYEQLKAYGLEYIQSIANKQWTDFNIHDPGVTILEALCFSLTDLAYRTRFGMNDLLTQKGSTHPQLSGTLFPAHEILTHEPITIDDYRKFILEHVPGVRNVWITNYDKRVIIPDDVRKKESTAINAKGFYDISLELEDEKYILSSDKVLETVRRNQEGKYIDLFDIRYKKAYKHYVKNFFLKHRNLCENIHKVYILDTIPIALRMEIETEKDADLGQLQTEIYEKVSKYVNPSLKTYTIQEMIKKGKTPEEIYQGLLPRYGNFIDMDELRQFDKKTSLYSSDILNIIMKIDGVVSIKHLSFIGSEDDQQQGLFEINTINNYCNEVALKNDNCVFRLVPMDKSDDNNDGNSLLPKHEIYFYRNGFTFTVAEPEWKQAKSESISTNSPVEYPLPNGQHRNTETYYTFQNLFPKTYGISPDGIIGSASNLRKAERLQLKAYLTFFDQLLADYLEQLSEIEHFFSTEGEPLKESIGTTYLFHELNDEEIADVSQILMSPKAINLSKSQKNSLEADKRSKCNRVLNHLLARFNDSFADYAILSCLNSQKKGSVNFLEFDNDHELEDKQRLLRNYASLSSHRSQAIDYTEEVRLNGLELHILSKLGINQPKFRIAPTKIDSYDVIDPENPDSKHEKIVFRDNRNESYDKAFGIHVIEHLLMLPIKALSENNTIKVSEDNFIKLAWEDQPSSIIDDPYSFRVTVLVPGWLKICQNMQFRNFVESTIRSEFPAHVVTKICWVDPAVMYQFETTYREFVRLLKQKPSLRFLGSNMSRAEWHIEYEACLKKMVHVFNSFRNIYPSITLSGEADNIQVVESSQLDFMELDNWYYHSTSQLWAFRESNTKENENEQ